MKRPTYEDRRKRSYQPASNDGNRFYTQERRKREAELQKGEERASDRSLSRGRNYRYGISDAPWNPSKPKRPQARPLSYQDLGSQSSSNKNRDSHLYQGSHLGNRNSGPYSAWDDRLPSTQSFDSSYPTSSYGSGFGREQQLPPNGNANQASFVNASQASYDRDDQGNFGSYESGQNFGTNGQQGDLQRQSPDSQSYSPTHYGTQHSGLDFGQHYGTGQQLYGNDCFASNPSGRGSKGYKRSVERSNENVCELLTSPSEIDPSAVDIQQRRSESMLTGTVDNRQAKRLIED